LHERFIPAADLFGPAATTAACGAIVDAFNARHAAGSIVIVIVLVVILTFIEFIVVRPLTKPQSTAGLDRSDGWARAPFSFPARRNWKN